MATNIDDLQIEISASASKANTEIDKLISRLGKLSNSLSSVNGSSITGLANGVQKLGTAMQSMSNVKTADFSRLSRNITKLGSLDTSALNRTASSMSQITRSFNQLGSVSSNAVQVGELAKSISKLGNKGVQNAITNIPQLATAMKQLMTTLSTAPTVSSNIIQMTNALANLANQGSKVGSVSKNLVGGMNKTHTSINRTAKSTKSLAYAFGKFYANYFLFIRAFKGLFNSIESTADYIEAFNYFNVAIGKIASEWSHDYEKYGYENAEAYAESFNQRLTQALSGLSGVQVSIGADGSGLLTETGMKNLGLNIKEITQYASQLASVTNSVGQTGEVSLAAAEAFTKLGADISSLFNLDYSAVMTNLQSGLIGQSRALYKYGIDITNATLQTYAYELGLEKAVSEMTQAEKMQLRMIAILDQSKVSWGDLANTLNSPSNLIRQFTNNLKEAGMVLGQLFMPLLQKVLPVINGVTIAIKRLLVSIAGFLGISLDLSSFGQGYSDMADGAGDLSDSLGDAAASAKKLKTATLGIDELNINAPQDDTTGGSGAVGGGIDLTKEILAATDEYQKVWQEAFDKMESRAQAFADNVEKFLEPIKKMFENLSFGNFEGAGSNLSEFFSQIMDINWDNVYAKASGFGTGLAEFLNGLISPELFGKVGETIAGYLNTAVYAALSFGTTFDWTNWGTSVAEGINRFFETFDFTALADSIDAWVQGIWETISTAIKEIDWLTVYDKITEFLENLDIETIAIIIGVLTIKKIGNLILTQGLLTWISSGLSKLLTNIPVAISSIKILASGGLVEGTSVVAKLADSLALAAGGAGTLNEALTLAFGTVATTVAGIMTIVGGAILSITNFVSMLTDGFSWIKEALMVVGIALTAVGAIILGAPALVAGVVAGIVAAVATLVVVVKDNWETIKGFFAGVGAWFDTNVITPVVGFFKGLWESVSGFFSNLWSDIQGIWGSVSNWFSAKIIEPISSFFEGLALRIGQIFEGIWIIIQAVWIIASTWINENFIIPVTEMFTMLWENIQLVWSTVSTWFDENVIIPLTGFFKGVWTNVSQFFVNLWDDIQKVWKTVSTWFGINVITPLKNAWNTAINAIAGFFEKLWDGIKKGVAGAMNAVIGGIESALNKIISGINNVLDGFNSAVQWAADIVGVSWSGVTLIPNVSLPRIPAYATGGFPEDGLFMANHNELVGQFSDGRTAVANNEQIVAGIEGGVERAVTRALQPYLADIVRYARETAEKEMSVNIGDRDIARANARGQRSLGYSLVT